mmetsp:Transcript_92601/g.288700  ORF Transcript_92601/g.288700 Transcript_92601/m.288700 type:complete len:636 (-) Transcript_92601:6-1913(-)
MLDEDEDGNLVGAGQVLHRPHGEDSKADVNQHRQELHGLQQLLPLANALGTARHRAPEEAAVPVGHAPGLQHRRQQGQEGDDGEHDIEAGEEEESQHVLRPVVTDHDLVVLLGLCLDLQVHEHPLSLRVCPVLLCDELRARKEDQEHIRGKVHDEASDEVRDEIPLQLVEATGRGVGAALEGELLDEADVDEGVEVVEEADEEDLLHPGPVPLLRGPVVLQVDEPLGDDAPDHVKRQDLAGDEHGGALLPHPVAVQLHHVLAQAVHSAHADHTEDHEGNRQDIPQQHDAADATVHARNALWHVLVANIDGGEQELVHAPALPQHRLVSDVLAVKDGNPDGHEDAKEDLQLALRLDGQEEAPEEEEHANDRRDQELPHEEGLPDEEPGNFLAEVVPDAVFQRPVREAVPEPRVRPPLDEVVHDLQLVHGKVLCQDLLLHQLADVDEAVEPRGDKPDSVDGPERHEEVILSRDNVGGVCADFLPRHVLGDLCLKLLVGLIRQRHLVAEVHGVLLQRLLVLRHLHLEEGLVLVNRGEGGDLQAEERATKRLGQQVADLLAVLAVRHLLVEVLLQLVLIHDVGLVRIHEDGPRQLHAIDFFVPADVHGAGAADVQLVGLRASQGEDHAVLALALLLDGT